VTQLNLFPQPLPSRRTDPETSKIAAHSHRRAAAAHCDRILTVVLAHPGLTYREIQTHLPDLTPEEVMRRLGDLERRRFQVEKGPKRADSITGGQMSTWFGRGKEPKR
jgi:hypothetical protein